MPRSRILLAFATLGGLCFGSAGISARAAQGHPAPSQSSGRQNEAVAAIESAYLRDGGQLAPGSSRGYPAILPSFYDYQLLEVVSYEYSSARQPTLDADIAVCEAAPVSSACAPRIRAYGDFIRAASMVMDLRSKAELVEGFVDIMLNYDYARLLREQKEGDSPSFHGNDRDLTPRQSLLKGYLECLDEAHLKLDALRRVGFPMNLAFLITGLQIHTDRAGHTVSQGAHAVVGIEIDSQLYILENLRTNLSPAAFLGAANGGLSKTQLEDLILDSMLLRPGVVPAGDGQMVFSFGGTTHFSPQLLQNGSSIWRWEPKDFGGLIPGPGVYELPYLHAPARSLHQPGLKASLAQAFAQNAYNPNNPDAPWPEIAYSRPHPHPAPHPHHGKHRMALR